MAPNLGSPSGSVKPRRSIFLQVRVLDIGRSVRTIDSVSISSERSVFRRATRAVVRCCSLRNFVAVSVGGALGLLPLISAGPASSSIAMLPYAPQYPHQAYGYELALTRLQNNAPAREWLAAADRALQQPQRIELPFVKLAERFSDTGAVSYGFTVPMGRRIAITVTNESAAPSELFVDLFRAAPLRHERLTGALPGSGSQPIVRDIVEGGEYVLRVQPPLGSSAGYDISIEASPLLAFPVDGVDRRAIWSVFGAERDGGRRAHRGVDIFAARGTPVLAATDGWVTRVETTRVGGNVVWVQPLFGNMRVYYAHLHEQWVEPGDFVTAGEPLGAVGNTGNAITTPPHLHFGVYVRQPGMRGGAHDPAEFLR
jgi:murein DD-endopeptidase MepM/ murein hydrolase activator NlpD